jgi:hypothetical protein
MASNTTFVDYLCPRKFIPSSRLRIYLALKKPASQFSLRDTTTLQQILQYLKEIISESRQFDHRNQSIVLADPSLEAALDCKAFHLTEVR